MKKFTKKELALSKVLKPRQLLFANHYLASAQTGDTQRTCMRKAGYDGSNANLDSHSSRMIKSRKVGDYLAMMRARSMKEVGLTLEFLDKKLLQIVSTDLDEVIMMDENGDPKLAAHDIKDLSPGARATLKSVKVTREGLVVDLHSRMDAIKLAYQRLGGLTEKTETTIIDGGSIEIDADMTGEEAAQAYSDGVLGNG